MQVSHAIYRYGGGMSSAKAALESDTRVSMPFCRIGIIHLELAHTHTSFVHDCGSHDLFRCLLLKQEERTELE